MTSGKFLPLNTGAKMPAVGLGTWQAEPGEVGAAVKTAIECGYRHIDGAYAYRNEKEIGDTLQALFKEGKIKREDLFYTSKLWNTFHCPEDVAKGLDETLRDLQIGYLDLYLMHWPYAFKPGSDLFPSDSNGKIILEPGVDIVDTWKAMEKLVETGKVKAIGVSNFDIDKLKHLLANSKIRPAVNQVEMHPYLPQPALLEYCQKENIVVTAYSPLGSGKTDPCLIEDPVIKEIAKKHNKDVGQVLIAWAVQRGTIVLPKSVKAHRIQSNHQLMALDDEDMKKIDSIKTRKRFIDPVSFWKVDLWKGDTADK